MLWRPTDPISSSRRFGSSSAAHHASLMYGKNAANFLALLISDGAVAPNPDDDIVNQSTVAREGRIVNERVQAALDTQESGAS